MLHSNPGGQAMGEKRKIHSLLEQTSFKEATDFISNGQHDLYYLQGKFRFSLQYTFKWSLETVF